MLQNSVASQHDTPLVRDAPYRMPGQKLTCFFRHDGLSDAIGFEYSSWHGDDAAAHFAAEVGRLAEHYAADPNRVLLIALDGENAWEHYPFNGYYFLRGMYAALAADPRLELTTLSACLQRAPHAQPLPRVVAGSWVHGTLATWIGDPARTPPGICCARRRTHSIASSSRARSTQPRSPRPSGSSRCARVPTGSGGSATTTRPTRSGSSTGCIVASSPISTGC